MHDVISRPEPAAQRTLALDRAPGESLPAPAGPAVDSAAAVAALEAAPAPVTFALPAAPAGGLAVPPPPPRSVPDVGGLPLRDAVRALHDAGFRVDLVRGAPAATSPAAGAMLAAGSVVRLRYDF
jgi:hypothetical protein